MRYQIRGKGGVNLTQRNFIAKGGEGKIFSSSGVVFKIYENPSGMIPEAKIEELAVLNRPNILRPLDIVLDKRDAIVGFTMSEVKNTVPICKMFTNTFRNDNGITDDMTGAMVERLHADTSFIHQKKCLIVDGNELNFLVELGKFDVPFFIDVNCYKTPSFPPTAIMPNIRDWTSKDFSELTDWFSFAIIACQLYVGIHPFKGKHPKYKKNEMQKRVMDSVSIFNKDVRVPKAVRDFGLIPRNYLDWMVELFENGKRIPPPTTAGAVGEVKEKIIVVTSTDNFEIRVINDFVDPILFYRYTLQREVTRTTKNLFLGLTKHAVSTGVNVVFTPSSVTPILAKIEKGMLKLKSLGKPITTPTIAVSEIMVVDNTLYTRHEGDLCEFKFSEIGDKILVSSAHVWNIAPKSSLVFTNVIYHSLLGVPYLFIPIPEVTGKTHSIAVNVCIDELAGYKVLDAKYDDHVCVVLGHKDNQYDLIVIKFDNSFKHVCRVIPNVDDQNVNFVTMEKGIVVLIHDDKMEVFSKNPMDTTIKLIEDKDLDSDMRLCKHGAALRFHKGKKLYSIKMK